MPRKPTQKQLLTAEGVTQGKSPYRAALDAGYSIHAAKKLPYISKEKGGMQEVIQARIKQALEASNIHTDEITGHLVQMLRGTFAEVLPTNKLIKKAKKKGVDGLIKKLHVRYKKVGDKVLPDGTKVPIIKEEVDIELYSRLEAANQLRDNFGMKQEPRANTFEETRRQEVEKHLDRIAESEKCDRQQAAKMLVAALPEDSPLIATVNKYVN